MAVLDRISTARDDTFSARIAMILMSLAINVMNEAPDYANHANRLAFAQKHLKGLVNSKLIGAAMIANNVTTQANIDSNPTLLGSNVPDGDIEFVLSSLFDNFSNAYAAT
jgi:hypothetical protein